MLAPPSHSKSRSGIWSKHSPVTVAGTAPDYEEVFASGFPFHPIPGNLLRRFSISEVIGGKQDFFAECLLRGACPGPPAGGLSTDVRLESVALVR